MLKNHNCGELNLKHVDEEVLLAGWVNRRRDHGGLIFIDLRDRSGIVQVVFNPEISPAAHASATELRSEYVLQVKGKVSRRPAGTENPDLPTGEIEIVVGAARILNTAKTPPFYINEDAEVDENLRLKYRYLDLRRARMRDIVIMRHNVVKFIRDFLDVRGFLEIETPILIKSTPEGARDYLVPARLYPGKFYALPQSPQQLKQLLMVGGIEKYFQIAKCFRDEDTRADRQPEFTQLDLEMSFVEPKDILDLMEELFVQMLARLKPDMKMLQPFPRLGYAEVMEKYGSDKPDLRFGLEIKDLSNIAAQTEFSIFRNVVADGGRVRGIYAPGCAGYTRSQLEELNQIARASGAQGLVTIALGSAPGSLDNLTMENVKSVVAKYLTLEQVKDMAALLGAQMGDLLLIVAGKSKIAGAALGELRKTIGYRLKLAPPDMLALAFVQQFPLLRRDEKLNRWESEHHPFTAAVDEDVPLLDTAPEKVRGKHYDVVCNGYEIGGGSIRIHQADVQRRVFRLLGHSDAYIEDRFGHMLEAFDFGAPPHGGIALGIDRIIMLLTGTENIREVIAFPKNQNAVDLMFNSPASVTQAQLDELHLCVETE